MTDPSKPLNSKDERREEPTGENRVDIDMTMPCAGETPIDESAIDASSMPDTDDGFDDHGKQAW